ncbi:MAG: WD40 repeat domain-containing protein [Armatimonadota bacterium]|nr:WD40 repeat domain-containing protein [Armatimonadota bacterium]
MVFKTMFGSQWKRWHLVVPLVLFGLLSLLIGRRPRLLPGLGGSATAIAFSPDSKSIVCASNNGYVQKWMPDIKKWRSFGNTRGYMTNLSPLFLRLRFSPDGQTLYAGGSHIDSSYSSVAHAWDVTTRRRKFSFNYLKSPAFDISPDGRWAALGYRNFVTLVDLNGKPAPPRQDGFHDPSDFRVLPYHKLSTTGTVTAVAFSPDSRTLVAGYEGFQWQFAFWHVESAERVLPRTPPAASNPVEPAPSFAFGTPSSGAPSFLEWSPDGERVAAISCGKIAIYDVMTSGVIEVPWPSVHAPPPATMGFGFNPGDTAPLAWSPDGQWLFSGGDEVRQWRTQDLKLWHSYGVPGPVAISPDGKTLATASRPEPGAPQGVLLWKTG